MTYNTEQDMEKIAEYFNQEFGMHDWEEPDREAREEQHLMRRIARAALNASSAVAKLK